MPTPIITFPDDDDKNAGPLVPVNKSIQPVKSQGSFLVENVLPAVSTLGGGILGALATWWAKKKSKPTPKTTSKPKPIMPPKILNTKTSKAVVVYRGPLYDTKKLVTYGRYYTGATMLDPEAFIRFRGSGKLDPALM